jgi:hypothetical protein
MSDHPGAFYTVKSTDFMALMSFDIYINTSYNIYEFITNM